MSRQRTTWLVTGTSRGIGLELVRQISSEPSATVFAALRNPDNATALHEIKSKAEGTVHIIKLDISSEESVINAAKEVEAILNGKGIDYLLNSAAISAGDDRAFRFDIKDLVNCFTTNVVGPALVGRSFIDAVSRSQRKVIVNLTSGLASFTLDLGAHNSSYSISKAALNMLAYKQARERKEIISIILDPGWVMTDMGGPNAQLEVDFSVKHIIHTVTSLKPEQSGKFFGYKGNEIPW